MKLNSLKEHEAKNEHPKGTNNELRLSQEYMNRRE